MGTYDLPNLFWISVDSPSFVVNRWLSVRFNLLSAVIIGVTGLVCFVTPSISASTAGFALAFASTISNDLMYLVCFEWTWLNHFLSWIASRLEDLSHSSYPWYNISTELICRIFRISYLRLGRLRTCQGIHRNQTRAAGVYRTEALTLMAVQWSY